MGKQRTNEEFKNEVFQLVGDEYTFLEDFKQVGLKLKVRHNCKQCNNHEYYVSPANFIYYNSRCPKCANIPNYTKENLISKLKTTINDLGRIPLARELHNPSFSTYRNVFGSFEKALIEAGFERHKDENKYKINSNAKAIEILVKTINEYKQNKKPLTMRTVEKITNYSMVNICESFGISGIKEFNSIIEHEFQYYTINQSDLDNNIQSNKNFLAAINKLVGEEYTFLDDYYGMDVPLNVVHESHWCNFNEFSVTPYDFIKNNKRCPVCGKYKQHNKLKFIKNICQITGEEYTFLDDYIDDNTPLRAIHESDKCEYFEFNVAPYDFIKNGFRCPKCKANSKIFILRHRQNNQIQNNNNEKKYNEYTKEEKDKILNNIIKFVLNSKYALKSEDVSNIEGVKDYRFLQFVFAITWSSFKKQLDLNIQMWSKFNKLSDIEVISALKNTTITHNIRALYDYSFNRPDSSFAAIYYYKRFDINNWDEFINKVLSE